MSPREIRQGIHSVGAIDSDRKLFDELIPLPGGTSYNSYLIKGNLKTALIDTVDPTKAHVLFENLDAFGVKKIDYVIANHAEQDHSGTLPKVLEQYPEAKVVTNAKCRDMLIDHLHISPEKFISVGDGETLDLGGRTLEFIIAPWVHWPETMFTYLKEEKIIFTCDFLGSHLATSDLFVTDEIKVYEAAKRYYAEIMMPFRVNIRKHLERIRSLAIDIIATSHGPIYDKPKFILDAYADWASDKVKNEVVISYVSMHGSTQIAVDRLVDSLASRNVAAKPFNLTKTDIGELAIALVDAATIIIATPTVLAGAHPHALFAATLVGALRPKTKFFGIINSFGWGGKAAEQVAALVTNLKVEHFETVSIKGLPKQADLEAIDNLAKQITTRHSAVCSFP